MTKSMTVDAPVRVLVVDDSDTARTALAETVGGIDDFTLVGSRPSGEEALDALPELAPDLVLLDVHMPGLNGHETAQRMLAERPGLVVVLVSADPSEAHMAPEATTFLPKSEVTTGQLQRLWSLYSEAAALRGEADQIRRKAHELKAESADLRDSAITRRERSNRIRHSGV
jgi:chemotaxis response regulator CheB